MKKHHTLEYKTVRCRLYIKFLLQFLAVLLITVSDIYDFTLTLSATFKHKTLEDLINRNEIWEADRKSDFLVSVVNLPSMLMMAAVLLTPKFNDVFLNLESKDFNFLLKISSFMGVGSY